jgi:hypothetical protein
MENRRKPGLPYRCQLVGTAGSAIMLVGLCSYSNLRLPFPLPPQGFGLPLAAVGFLVIVWSGWCVYSRMRAAYEQRDNRALGANDTTKDPQ